MIINFIMLLITVILAVKKRNRWAILFFFISLFIMQIEFFYHASDVLKLDF